MENVSDNPSNNVITEPAIMCDNGSDTIRYGFICDEKPRALISTIVGTSREEITVPSITYSGQFVIDNPSVFDMSWPISNDNITDWDAMERLWYEMYYDNLYVSSNDFNILHTEPINNTMSCRQKLFEVPNYCGLTKLLWESIFDILIKIMIEKR